MKIRDQVVWDRWVTNNKDGYGQAIIHYAERWADLMEAQIDNGLKLENIAKDTSHEADIEGITGYMYGAAVAVLSSCWKYGEILRQWHNLETQIGNEGVEANKSGKVLNPALLSIG
jgi:hypothetical protein